MIPKFCSLNVYILSLVQRCIFCNHVYNSSFSISVRIQYVICLKYKGGSEMSEH